MREFEVIGHIGDKETVLKISETRGGINEYQIYVDKYYQGTISKIKGEWVAHLNQNTRLTGDDVTVIIEIIETNTS